jgi:hypothetical protein
MNALVAFVAGTGRDALGRTRSEFESHPGHRFTSRMKAGERAFRGVRQRTDPRLC